MQNTNKNLLYNIIGYTPVIKGATRGVEINKFLSNLNYKPNFIILDDDEDMDNLLPYLIKINARVGLTDQNVKDGIIKLNKLFIKENEDFER